MHYTCCKSTIQRQIITKTCYTKLQHLTHTQYQHYNKLLFTNFVAKFQFIQNKNKYMYNNLTKTRSRVKKRQFLFSHL